MKNLLVLNLVLFFAHTGSAAELKKIQINPQTLRTELLSGNTSVLLSLNHIHQAKDRVNIARGNLLPSVNLTVVMAVMANPSFALGAVEFLVPFLIPSRWFDYFQQKDVMEAEKQGYHTLQLNALASAYSLYYTVVSDQRLLEVVKAEAADLKEVYDILVQRDAVLGNVLPSDLLHAKSQMELAAARVAKVSELLILERAEIRKALALPVDTEIEFVDSTVPGIEWENKTIDEAVTHALSIAPESRQLTSLLSAAEMGKWSKIFAFISGVSVGSQGAFGPNGNVGTVSFDHLYLRQNVNFGFAYYPAIELSQKNIEEVKIRQRELKIENTTVLEKTLLGLKQATQRRDLTANAQKSMHEVYLVALKKFEMGMETLLNLLITRKQVTDSSVELIAAEANLNLQRVVLNRALIQGEFAQVKGCNINEDAVKQASVGSAWEWVQNLFSGRNASVAIDKACLGVKK